MTSKDLPIDTEQGALASPEVAKQSSVSKSVTAAPYCNWQKGGYHNDRCPNPTQCYCICHSDKAKTDYKLKTERTYCQNRIIAINKILGKRQERVTDLASNNPEVK